MDSCRMDRQYYKPQYYLPRNFPLTERLRACMNCGLLKTFQQFCKNGCDNCENIFQFKRNPERIIIFTSLKFEGIVGLTLYNNQWKSKLIYVEKFCCGVYAIYVFGKISDRLFNNIIGIPYWELQ